MSQQSLSEQAATKLNELGLTEIQAKHIPFLVFILLVIVLVILYFTVKQVKKGVLSTTFHFPEHMVNQVTSEEKDEESMCPEYKVSAVDFEKVSPSDSAENKTEETVSSGRKIKHAPVAGGGSS